MNACPCPVLSDARVKNAELLEFQRQAADGGAQALHWRRAIAAKVGDPPVSVLALYITPSPGPALATPLCVLDIYFPQP